LPNPFLDIVRAVGAVHSGQGQTYSASGRDLHSLEDDQPGSPVDDVPLQPANPNDNMLALDQGTKGKKGSVVKPMKTDQAMQDFVKKYGGAAKEAGVPESWLSDPYLWRLLAKESSSSPGHLSSTLKSLDPKSSAYGMFQFLKKTWGGYPYPKSDDPYQQIVDGLMYIKANYHTPKHAWDVWQQNKAKDPKHHGHY
jgi:hypothetical protein